MAKLGLLVDKSVFSFEIAIENNVVTILYLSTIMGRCSWLDEASKGTSHSDTALIYVLSFDGILFFVPFVVDIKQRLSVPFAFEQT